ncbi:MAG: DUF3667 domain-containing protein [Bacteroidota bacterium]
MRIFKKGNTCGNCGATLDPDFLYCPRCGQENDSRDLSLRTFTNELAEDSIGLDSRFRNSIKPFLFSPGMLSLEFLHGRRRPYIPPVRLYLFMSFICFVFINFREAYTGEHAAFKPVTTAQFDSVRIAQEHAKEKGQKFVSQDFNMSPNSGLGSYIVSRYMHYKTDLAGINQQTVRNMPAFLLVMVFLFALILKLLYRHSGLKYIEHLVFALHMQAFFLFISVPGDILYMLLNMPELKYILFTFEMSVFFVYFYLGMRRFYVQPVAKTVLKITLFTVAYSLVWAILSIPYFLVILMLY